MSDLARMIPAALFMIAGVLFAFVSFLGVYRFKFVMNRMQCAAILDTCVMGCLMIGLMIAAHSWTFVPKLVAILVVLWVSSPIASHLVGRMEIDTDETAHEHVAEREEDKGNGSH